MADLRIALEDADVESVSAARLRTRARPFLSRPWAMAVSGLLIVAAGISGWRMLRTAEAPAPTIRADILSAFPGKELYPSLSPDGKYVVFTWNGPQQDNTDVYVQQIGVGSPLRLTTDASDDYNPVWAPDGRQIAFLRGTPTGPLARNDREIRLIPPLGGPERGLATVRVQEASLNPTFLTWCPDSSCVVVADASGEGKPDALFVISSFLYYSPPPRGRPAPVWRMSVTGGPAVKILDGVVNYSFAILEKGAYFMTLPSTGMALEYLDFSTGRSTTIAGGLGDGLASRGFAVSPDGRTMLYVRRDSSIDDLMLVENIR